MKIFGCLFLMAALVIGGIQLKQEILSNYRWENNYSQNWELADKSSTIPAKQQYIRSFVEVLEKGNQRGEFASYNAMFLQTPNNSFRSNLNALHTLDQRLTEIQSMDISSFQYNTAIQQITAQEQGEAHSMLGMLEGCYRLTNYSMVWDWIGMLTLASWIVLGVFGVILIGASSSY